MRQVVAYKRLKTMENHLSSDSNCKALTGRILGFWIGGRLWEVVAYERWSHMEVRLYFIWKTNLNPLSPTIHLQIPQTELHTFP